MLVGGPQIQRTQLNLLTVGGAVGMIDVVGSSGGVVMVGVKPVVRRHIAGGSPP